MRTVLPTADYWDEQKVVWLGNKSVGRTGTQSVELGRLSAPKLAKWMAWMKVTSSAFGMVVLTVRY